MGLAGLARRGGVLVLALLMMTCGAAARASGAPAEVGGQQISMLVRSTLVALHQANITGNYTVLRDLGGARFQATFSASALADRFRAFRDRRINLGPAVLFDAQLDAGPVLTTDGLLRIRGHFPTAPQEVIFDITYHFEADQWRLEDLNVGLRPAVAELRPAATADAEAGATGGIAPVPQMRPAKYR